MTTTLSTERTQPTGGPGKQRLLLQRYKAIRGTVGRLVGSNYDLTNKCNLSCEGCLYFSGDDIQDYDDRSTTAEWEHFFRREAARGVNFAYLAGAEPSLVPERIAAAWRNIGNGVVFTNGTRRIDPNIDFRIHISIWGDVEQTKDYRGAGSSIKALNNYAGDPRAVVIMTLNALNLTEVGNVARQCAEHKLPLSFSYFSPTTDYLRRITQSSNDHSDYFRISSQDRHLMMGPEALREARSVIEQAMSDHPDTIIYSLAFDDWLTNPGGIYRLDEAGIAIDCGNRLTSQFRHFSVKLEEHAGKCCSPNLDCQECRAYAMAYASFLTRHGKLRADDSMEKWLDVWETWTRLFLRSGAAHSVKQPAPSDDKEKAELAPT